jgi:hypothetical protein
MARLLHSLKQKRENHRFNRSEDQPMGKLLGSFWRDDRGYVPVMEWMLVASILSLGAYAALLVMQSH